MCRKKHTGLDKMREVVVRNVNEFEAKAGLGSIGAVEKIGPRDSAAWRACKIASQKMLPRDDKVLGLYGYVFL